MRIDDDGQLLGSVDDMAALVGITARRVQQLENARITLRVGHGVYDLARSVLSYCNWVRGPCGDELKINESRERARLTKMRADQAELDLAERQGVLVNAEVVRKQDFALGRVLRNNLQTMPDRIAALVAASSDPAECHRLIADEVRASLEGVIESLSTTEVDPASLDVNRTRAAEQLDVATVSAETGGGHAD